MSLIEIQRRCDDCETSRALVREVRAELGQMRLDYENLYEKVRTNLTKLARRVSRETSEEEEAPAPDPMQKARQELVSRKMRRSNALR